MDLKNLQRKTMINSKALKNSRPLGKGATEYFEEFSDSNMKLSVVYDYNPNGMGLKQIGVWMENQIDTSNGVFDWQTENNRKVGLIVGQDGVSLVVNKYDLTADSKQRGYKTIGEAFRNRKQEYEADMKIADEICKYAHEHIQLGSEYTETDILKMLEDIHPGFSALYEYAVNGNKEQIANIEANNAIKKRIGEIVILRADMARLNSIEKSTRDVENPTRSPEEI